VRPDQHYWMREDSYSHPKIHDSVAALIDIHRTGCSGTQLLVVQHPLAWDLVRALEVLRVDAVLDRNFLYQEVEVLGQQLLRPEHFVQAQAGGHRESVNTRVRSSQVEHNCTQRQGT
jgi:hypothetical protein